MWGNRSDTFDEETRNTKIKNNTVPAKKNSKKMETQLSSISLSLRNKVSSDALNICNLKYKTSKGIANVWNNGSNYDL